jgi:hypothetical protein
VSADVYYRPVKPSRFHLVDCGAPSNFKEGMEKAFGCFPLVLDKGHLDSLRAMAVVWQSDALEEVIEGIEKCGAIELFVDWNYSG